LIAALTALISVAAWGGVQLSLLSADTTAQSQRWAANRAEAALSRELMRILIELNYNNPGPIYEQYGAELVAKSRHIGEPNRHPLPHPRLQRTGDYGLRFKDLTVLEEHPMRYPAAARAAGMEGYCTVWFTVDEVGRVPSARVDVCDARFHSELIEGALLWRFKPVFRSGIARRVEVPRTYPYRADIEPEPDVEAPTDERATADEAATHSERVQSAWAGRKLKAAELADLSIPHPQLVLAEETPFLVVLTPTRDGAWVFEWEKVADVVESRSGVRITVDSEEASERRLALGSALSGPEVWLHPRPWCSLTGTSPDKAGLLDLSGIQVDLEHRSVVRDGEALHLTTKETELLTYLSQRPGEVVERDELLRDVWGYRASVQTRSADNTVLRLRAKIERDPSRPRHLHTIHGVGYRFDP